MPVGHVVSAVLLVVVLTACGSTSSDEPDGFPPDFPLYAHASLQGAGLAYGHPAATWKTKDDDTKVIAFYERRLNSGDWHIVDEEETTIDFVRQSNPHYGGTLEVRSGSITVRLGPGCPC